VTQRWVLITHPNVVIDPGVAVTRWPLSELGRARMRAGLQQPWVRELTALHCSTEQKAIDSAQIVAEHVGLPIAQHEDLGENDRSATGFLPPPEFEHLADNFFGRPHESVRGWERAVNAQRRIVAAVGRIARVTPPGSAVAIVSHGAVGTLLHCHLAGREISRRWDQPANGGGNWFAFSVDPAAVLSGWRPIDEATA
jgi:broad specificity phosphatase PhoE